MTTTTTATNTLKSDAFFNDLKTVLSGSPDLVKSINASYLFQITDGGKIAGRELNTQTFYNLIIWLISFCLNRKPCEFIH